MKIAKEPEAGAEKERSWSVSRLVFLSRNTVVSRWQVPSSVLVRKRVHLPLVPTSPHHEEVRRGFRGPCHTLTMGVISRLIDDVNPQIFEANEVSARGDRCVASQYLDIYCL